MTFRHLLCAIGICVVARSGAQAQSYTISTLVGNGINGYAGDGGALSGAELGPPAGIVVDSGGNVYISDSVNNRVRKISNGIINTYAGNGTAGFTGDGAAATSAELNHPAGLALDSSGNLYIADSDNQVIRKVTSAGIISTFAGNNGFGRGNSGDNGPATNAQLNGPTALAFDSAGNAYIVDSGNNVIRRVTKDGTITTLVGGGGTSTSGGLNAPSAVAVDPAGNLYIADTNNKRIRKLAGGQFTTYAGNGTLGFSGDGTPATLSQLSNPKGLALDSAGNLYIADTGNSRIRRVSPAGIINTIAGNGAFKYYGDGGPATSAALNFPGNLTLDAQGNIYVCDTNNFVVRVLTPILPVVSDGGVTNAASFLPQVSPGALASVFGSNFALSPVSASVSTAGTFPTTLGGVSVTVNGKAAPLTYVDPNQVNFQVPWETTGGTASVIVSVGGAPSNAVSVPLKTAGPGIFADAAGHAIAENPDLATLNSASNPAPAGSFVVTYLTGSGPVDNQPATGAVTPLSPLSTVKSSFSATLGATSAPVAMALAPYFFGVLQANVTIPAGLAPGDYQLKITINGETSNAATISVK